MTGLPVPSLRLRTVTLVAVFGFTSFFVSAAPVQRDDPRPEALKPATAKAAICADGPSFEGRITANSSSTTAITESTTGNVAGYISNIVDDWSCTASFRYDGLVWAKTASASSGNFDWGNLLASDTIACNWDIGTTDYLKANSTTDCPDSDAEYAMPIFLGYDSGSNLHEVTFQNDITPDEAGDFGFIHSSCDAYYNAEVMLWTKTWDTASTTNRPGANCSAYTHESTNTSQTIVVDGTAPTTAFDWPATGATATIRSAFATVRFDATDNLAGFSGTDDWDLQRRKGTWNGSTCSALANDGTAASGTTAALDQVVTHPLEVGPCYQWTLAARDANGNVASTTTSGTVVVDPGPTLGLPSWSPTESWDLGAGDTLSVNPATGNLVLSHPVLDLPIRGSSVGLTLTYNRHDPTNVGMGPGWRLDVLRRLSIAGNGDVTVSAGDGSRHVFTWTGSAFTRPRPCTRA